MAISLWMITLAVTALLIMDRASPPQPNCEHMAEFPCCSQTLSPDCGTDTVTCNNECQLCLAWMKTKKDIQILKDGKC
uniref:Kazal-like domain-containing protein n=1 Tax=Loxodonta africana TaxID=9785 RepID=G3SRS7_LOXAF